jgi:hypothetical protein
MTVFMVLLFLKLLLNPRKSSRKMDESCENLKAKTNMNP